jgi:hypothetical protein
VTKISDEATIRSEVAAAAKKAASQSVEGTLPLQELKGIEGRGYYFSATDRAPGPGEYVFACVHWSLVLRQTGAAAHATGIRGV